MSEVEINITKFGLRLLVLGTEYFLPYEEYAWFLGATIADINQVELLHNRHLYWPKLDIDLDIKSLEDPRKYPLVYSKDLM